MIKNYTLQLLEKAINQALSLDPSRQSQIQALQGKALEMVIEPLEISFFFHFSENELKILSTYDGVPDTIIRSSPLGLIRLSLLPTSKIRSLFNDEIKVSGDIELGQSVKKLFNEMDIDWEGHLAQFTGDVVAYQIGSFFRKKFNFQKQVGASLKQNLADYLQEELRLCPPREEIEDFFKDIDTLSLDVERLSARINQMLVSYEIN